MKSEHRFTEQWIAGEQDRLMLLLGFDREDLEANREGHLTKKQRRRLADLQTRWLILTVLGGCFGAAVCFSLLIRWTASNIIPSLIVGSATITSVVYCATRWKRLKNDLYKGIVTFVEGYIRLNAMYRYKSNPRYSIQIEGLEFKISHLVFSALMEGASYCIYYVPSGNMILSIELLKVESGKADPAG